MPRKIILRTDVEYDPCYAEELITYFSTTPETGIEPSRQHLKYVETRKDIPTTVKTVKLTRRPKLIPTLAGFCRKKGISPCVTWKWEEKHESWHEARLISRSLQRDWVLQSAFAGGVPSALASKYLEHFDWTGQIHPVLSRAKQISHECVARSVKDYENTYYLEVVRKHYPEYFDDSGDYIENVENNSEKTMEVVT